MLKFNFSNRSFFPKTFLSAFLGLLFFGQSFAHGVAVVNADAGIYLRATRSDVRVRVENQVGITTSTTWFRNTLHGTKTFKFAFPMPAGSTATQLRWFIGGQWHVADFKAEAQDTTLPGGGGPGGGTVNQPLTDYLGATPLFFEIKDEVSADSTVAVELTFVELLPYKFGVVSWFFPADYHLIQSYPFENQHFEWTLFSARKIETVAMPGFPDAQFAPGEHESSIAWQRDFALPNLDMRVEYTLNADDLGLFSFSNYFPDSALNCDDFGRGFCAFLVEPVPNADADVIPKVFTLILDSSGSMSGVKMEQAKEAASFIVQHMNLGDKFNIIDFDDQIKPFRPDHVDFTPSTEAAALSFISGSYAGGSTNISGAFSEGISEFKNDANSSNYNVILFFTDGQATVGITDDTGILNAIRAKIQEVEANLSIFCFGIGGDVNRPLLTQISNENKGTAEFLDNNEVADVISDFYLTVKSPVLLNTAMAFTPALVRETYPAPLPNLFKGVQMLVVGRYAEPANVSVDFSGEAFGAPVHYTYPMNLTAADSAKYHFLPKLWAKQKSAHLLQKFYAATNQQLADALKKEIQDLATCYGVITPFTSFVDNGGNTGGGTAVHELSNSNGAESLVRFTSVSPNPASARARLGFSVKNLGSSETVRVRVLDVLGNTVRHQLVQVGGEGEFFVDWDLTDFGGKRVAAGTYFLELETSVGRAVGRIVVE